MAGGIGRLQFRVRLRAESGDRVAKFCIEIRRKARFCQIGIVCLKVMASRGPCKVGWRTGPR